MKKMWAMLSLAKQLGLQSPTRVYSGREEAHLDA